VREEYFLSPEEEEIFHPPEIIFSEAYETNSPGKTLFLAPSS